MSSTRISYGDTIGCAFIVGIMSALVIAASLGFWKAAQVEASRAKARYVVTDSSGRKFEGMEILTGGTNWVKFRDSSGKELVVNGNYSYEEQ